MVLYVYPVVILGFAISFLQIFIGANIFFKEYELLFQPTITGLQIAIGLVGLITIFYLGKIHDYKREFLKYEIENIFASIIAKKIIHSVLNDEEKTKWDELTEFLTTGFNEMRHNYFRLPKISIGLGLAVIGFFVMSLLTLIAYRESSSIFGFILGIVFFGIGVYYLIQLWLLNERIISNLDKGFKMILINLKLVNRINENKEDFKEHFGDIIDSVNKNL